jgi:hypothetical protein
MHTGAFLPSLYTPVWRERLAAVETLGCLEPQDLALHQGPLLDGAGDKKAVLRLQALGILRTLPAPAFAALAPFLAGMVNDADARVRLTVVRLVYGADPAGFALFAQQVLPDLPHTDTKCAVLQRLVGIGGAAMEQCTPQVRGAAKRWKMLARREVREDLRLPAMPCLQVLGLLHFH